MTKQYKGRTATIEIDEKNVIIKSSGFFSSSKKTIPLRDIKNVELSASSFFSKDTVEIYYGSNVEKVQFSNSADAKKAATEGGKFYTFNVDYRQQPEAFVYEIGEKRPEKKANVILTDNIIPAGERDQVMSRVYNAKRGIFNKGIVRNKIVFSVNNLHIYDTCSCLPLRSRTKANCLMI